MVTAAAAAAEKYLNVGHKPQLGPPPSFIWRAHVPVETVSGPCEYHLSAALRMQTKPGAAPLCTQVLLAGFSVNPNQCLACLLSCIPHCPGFGNKEGGTEANWCISNFPFVAEWKIGNWWQPELYISWRAHPRHGCEDHKDE